jgi:hypothetical protein
MVYVDGMQGIIKHPRTIQWLYVLITKYGNKVREKLIFVDSELINNFFSIHDFFTVGKRRMVRNARKAKGVGRYVGR